MNKNEEYFQSDLWSGHTKIDSSAKYVIQIIFDYYSISGQTLSIPPSYFFRKYPVTSLIANQIYFKNRTADLKDGVFRFIEENNIKDLNEITGPLLTLFKLQVLK